MSITHRNLIDVAWLRVLHKEKVGHGRSLPG